MITLTYKFLIFTFYSFKIHDGKNLLELRASNNEKYVNAVMNVMFTNEELSTDFDNFVMALFVLKYLINILNKGYTYNRR